MRRKDKEMDADGAIELLNSCAYGILSTVDNDGQPYGIPLNYVYKDNHIYFHSALTGHKIDNLKDNSRVSFCVVADANVLPSKFATEYKSALISGVASEAHGLERSNAFLWLIEKYSPEYMEEGQRYIEKHDKVTTVIKIRIAHISGKQSPAKPR